ncbi:hypothetical protein PILCRDRAFT_520 [Piloderma croceum F 1598]|uniref:non-specific serine/threonine protein kinase n=1 Tax=Piloderma croceum (strain F 1598) TaxID=765440 RepID=A0A0C3CNJ4_PILCF|nr:hypothetical protein PILCRDRAFT_520 [Piloderma croceum F 1598]
MSSQVLCAYPNTQQTFDRKGEQDSGTCEEPLSMPAEEGYGYYSSAVVGHRLGQYKIVRKLRWARASSIWLCVDTAAPHKTYVAVKILSAHATGCIVGGLSTEYNVFRRIESANPCHPGFAHCLAIQHCFTVHSSAGGHICFVTDVLGPNMMTLRSAQPNQTFPMSVAKRIIKQILLSVDYLHRECGYIHTDIKADNVLASLPDPIVPQIDKYVEDHQSATYDNLKPSCQIIKSHPLTNFNLDLRHLRVRLIDYDEASPIDKHHDDQCQAAIVRAPEVTLGYTWSTPVDIWSVGCLVFELVTNSHLFGQPGPYSASVHLQSMVEYLGSFPPQFLEACSRSLLRVTDFMPTDLEEILYSLGTVQADDIPGVAAFMRQCLALDPASRPSALQLLNDKWLKDL